MPNLPDRSQRRRHRRARLRKLGLGVGIFCAIVGGYVAVERGRAAIIDATMPLPDVAERSGACTIWFIGSSTVFRWRTLRRDMAPWDAHNRGVNGALIPQIIQRFDNEPRGTPPGAIVIYAGENDIAQGATASQAFASFERFIIAKTARFGALPVIALSLKPSPARWNQRAAQTAFNDLLRRYAAARPDLDYFDIRPLMLMNERPGPFYVADGVHMNGNGYARWSHALRPALRHLLPHVPGRCASPADRR